MTMPPVGVPAAQNIDPNAGVTRLPPATPLYPGTGQAGEPSVSGAGIGAAPAGPAPQAPPPATPDITSVPAQATAILQDSQAELTRANSDAAQIWDQIRQQQSVVDTLQQQVTAGDITKQAALSTGTSRLNSLYQTLSSAMSRVESANAAHAQASQKVLDSVQLTPQQADYYKANADKANADAASARAQAQVLTDGAPGQQALVAAQAGLATAQGAAAGINAQIALAKSPAEIATLQAQAAGLNAQAQTTTALLPGLIAKQSAETGLTDAQTRLTDANSDLARANIGQVQANTNLLNTQAAILTPAQAGAQTAQANLANTQAALLTPAEAANQAATAQATLEGIKQKQQGPLYGLEDQINAIRAVQQHVFGPGGSGDPNDANDLLKQYVTATIGGTTPYAASVAAANAQQNQFQTQAAMANQASQSAAARAGQFANVAGGALGTLAQLNQYAPKGSNAMAGAFGSVMDYLGQRMAQGPMAPPNMQQIAPTPQLPSFLQAFAAGHQAGQAQAAAQAPQGQGQTPTINVNVNGQPAQASAPAAPAGPSPAQQFAQGFANNAPTMPNYLGGLTDPMSMLRTAQNNPQLASLYNQGPGLGTPAAGSLMY